MGTAPVLARTLNQIFNAALNALFGVFGLVLLKMFVKREALAAGLAIVLTMLLAVRGIFDGGAAYLNAAAALLIVTTIVPTIQKLGLVATIALFPGELHDLVDAGHAGPLEVVLREFRAADRDAGRDRMLRVLRIARRGAAARTAAPGLVRSDPPATRLAAASSRDPAGSA